MATSAQKTERMFGVVESWQRSGVGKHRYAGQNGICYSTLQYWCKRYREQHEHEVCTCSLRYDKDSRLRVMH